MDREAMETASVEELTQVLREIRDVAKELRHHDWAAATNLHYAIEDRLEVLNRPYKLHALFQSLKEEVHRACLSWLATHKQVETRQRQAKLVKDSRHGAEKLVRSIDTLLAAMKSPHPR